MGDHDGGMDASVSAGGMDASVPPPSPPPPVAAPGAPVVHANANGTQPCAAAPFTGMYDEAAGVCRSPAPTGGGGAAAPAAEAPANGERSLPPGFNSRTIGPALIGARDANLRIERYAEPARRMAERIAADYEAGRIGHLDARNQAVTGRTELLHQTRAQLSPGARRMSQVIREEGHTVEDMASRYALRLLENDAAVRQRFRLPTVTPGEPGYNANAVQRAVAQLRDTEEVSRMIVLRDPARPHLPPAAGRTNPVATGGARVIRVVAPIAAATGAIAAGYEVLNAERGERAWTAGRELVNIGGGTLGSMGGALVAGYVASLACGPGAAACALLITLTIGIASTYAGGRAASAAYEATVPRDTFSALPDAEDVVQAAPAAAGGPLNATAAAGGLRGAMHRDQAEFQRRPTAPRSSGGAAYIPSRDPNPGPTCGGLGEAPEELVCR